MQLAAISFFSSPGAALAQSPTLCSSQLSVMAFPWGYEALVWASAVAYVSPRSRQARSAGLQIGLALHHQDRQARPYLARANDPAPGSIVMWRGLSRLTDIELGVHVGGKNFG